MVGEYDEMRIADIAKRILSYDSAQAIERQKAVSLRKLRQYGKHPDPIHIAETEFELACCYLLRWDKRVGHRQLLRAEEHYNRAIAALASAPYAITRAHVQLAIAGAYDRLRSKKHLHNIAVERANEFFRAAIESFLETARPVEAAGACARLAEVWTDEGDRAAAIGFNDRAVVLLSQAAPSDSMNAAAVCDQLFVVQQKLADCRNRELLARQEEFSIRSAKVAVTESDGRFDSLPPKLLDELFEIVQENGELSPVRTYSPAALVEQHRARNTKYATPPPTDPDILALHSIGNVAGSQLLELANRYRNARTSPLGYAIVPVYYATDRQATGKTLPDDYFADGRDPNTIPSRSFGLCHVSIPRDHRTGSIERPRIWKFERRQRPDKHVMLLSLVPHTRSSFFSSLDFDLRSQGDGAGLLFIHGYNVRFSDALKRTAQLCYDLNWPGIPITYTWPSSAQTRLYPADEASIEATVPFLVDFLRDLSARPRLRTLHVVCHSMGSRALTAALKILSERASFSTIAKVTRLWTGSKARRPSINEVVLAAPDIDRELFTQSAAAIKSECERITLYASSKDLALIASRKLHAFPRAGDTGPGITILPGLVDTIDATDVDTNLLGHSYYGDERSIIGDLFGLLNGRSPPEKRFGLRELMSPAGRYWAFQP
jgi:esterase/lipase superfamily enzyme